MSDEEEDNKIEEEEPEEEPKPKSKKEESKSNILNKLPKQNYWMIASIVLVILLVIILITGGITGGAIGIINEEDAGQKILEFANEQGAEAELINVEEDGSLYLVTLLMEGQEIPVHITKDGKYLAQVVPLDLQIQTPQTPQPTPQSYSEEDLEKIKPFINCLAEKGVKVYGANWCGWTKKLVVNTLGGFDIAEPIYIECTENEDLCASEGVTGYPTIKINNELYDGERTLEGLATATSCEAPDIAPPSTTDAVEATC